MMMYNQAATTATNVDGLNAKEGKDCKREYRRTVSMSARIIFFCDELFPTISLDFVISSSVDVKPFSEINQNNEKVSLSKLSNMKHAQVPEQRHPYQSLSTQLIARLSVICIQDVLILLRYLRHTLAPAIFSAVLLIRSHAHSHHLIRPAISEHLTTANAICHLYTCI